MDASNQNLKYEQTRSLSSGTPYLIELKCAARQSQPLSTSGFRILWNNAVVFEESPAPNYSKNNYMVKVIASGSSNKIGLEGTGTPDSFGTSCDDV